MCSFSFRTIANFDTIGSHNMHECKRFCTIEIFNIIRRESKSHSTHSHQPRAQIETLFTIMQTSKQTNERRIHTHTVREHHRVIHIRSHHIVRFSNTSYAWLTVQPVLKYTLYIWTEIEWCILYSIYTSNKFITNVDFARYNFLSHCHSPSSTLLVREKNSISALRLKKNTLFFLLVCDNKIIIF